GALSFTVAGRSAAGTFIASLRIAKPQTVTVNLPSSPGSNGARQLPNIVGGIISKNVNVLLDEADQPVASVEAAAKLAGFPAQLPRARTDPPMMIVVGAHAIEMIADRSQLRTIYAEAGKKDVPLPESVDGSKVSVRT